MKRIHYARKKRQLKALAKKLQIILSKGEIRVGKEVDFIVGKIKSLLKEMWGVFSRHDLKKVLGTVAISLGLFYSAETSAQVFEAPQINAFGLTAVDTYAIPAIADLDGDGDLDMLTGEYNGAIQYFENTGSATNPQFASPTLNPFGLSSTYYISFPTFADLDNDGDLDLLVGEYSGDMQYFENTGTATSPAFASPVSNPFGLTSPDTLAIPEFVDLDNDGDFDLLVGEYYGAIKYYENTGTSSNPAFASPVQNAFGLAPTYNLNSPAAVDLDGDGDFDVLCGEYYGNMQYFENTGTASNPVFATPVQNPFGLVPVVDAAFPAFADFDGDGDMDLLVGAYDGNTSYFKNNLITGIGELSEGFNLSLFPNPTHDILRFEVEEQIDQIELVNMVGQTIHIYQNPTNQINVGDLENGFYMLRIKFTSGGTTISKIQKM